MTTRVGIAVLALALALPAGAAQAVVAHKGGTATITGKVATPPKKMKDAFEPTAYVAQLDTGGAIVPVKVAGKGSFKAKVKPGIYAVVSYGYGTKKPKVSTAVIDAAGGRQYDVRAASVPSIRVSVAGVAAPAGATSTAKIIAYNQEELLGHELASDNSCPGTVGVYPDRSAKEYKNAAKKLKKMGKAGKAALKALAASTPTVRISGQLTSATITGAAGTFTATSTATGAVVATTTVTATRTFDLAAVAARNLLTQLCTEHNDDATVPHELSGTFSGSIATPDTTLTWNGTVTKTFMANDPFTGGPYTDHAQYATTAGTVYWSAVGTCHGSGVLGTADLQTRFPDTSIDWFATPGKGWGYEGGLSPNVAMVVPCDGDRPPLDVSHLVGGPGGSGGALIYTSDVRGAETNLYSPDKTRFAGTLSINPGYPQTWTWNLTGSGIEAVPEDADQG